MTLPEPVVWLASPEQHEQGHGGDAVSFPWRSQPSNWYRSRRLIARSCRESTRGSGAATFAVLPSAYHAPDRPQPTAVDASRLYPGQWVAIAASDGSFDPSTVLWWGWLTSVDFDIPHGEADGRGVATAAGIGERMDLTQVRGWRWKDMDAAYGIAINSPPTANMQGRDGVVIGNGLTITDSGLSPGDQDRMVFARDPNDCGTTDPKIWTRWRLLLHALAYIMGGNGQDDGADVLAYPRVDRVLPVAAVQNLLDDATVREVYELRNLTFRGLLDMLIPDALGVGWWLRPYVSSGEIVWQLTIYPKNTVAATTDHAGAVATPVNLLAGDTSDAVLMSFTDDAGARPDRIIVRGARYLFAGTVGEADANVQRGWSEDQETTYKDAIGGTDAENRQRRRQPDMEDVGVRFVISSQHRTDIRSQNEPITGGADLGTGTGYSGSIVPLIPHVTYTPGGAGSSVKKPDGTAIPELALATVTSRAPYLPAARLASFVPWVKGVKVLDGEDERTTEAKSRPQYLRPLLFHCTEDGDGDWSDLLAEDLNETPGIEIDDHAPAIRIRYQDQNKLLKNASGAFEPPAPGDDDYDWRDLVLTIAMESDQHLEAVRDRVDGGTILHVLVVERPELGCWIVRKNTILGLKEDPPEPERRDADICTRDDHKALHRLADLLAAFLFLPRRAWRYEQLDPITAPAWYGVGACIGVVTDTLTGVRFADLAVNSCIESIERQFTLGASRLVIQTLVPDVPASLMGGSVSPSGGGPVSLGLSGTPAQAVQRLARQANDDGRDDRQRLIRPPRAAGGIQAYIVIDGLTGPADIGPGSGVTLDRSIKYDGAEAVTSVPTADPDDTDAEDITPDANLGKGILRDGGEPVWVALRADPGTGAVQGVASDIPVSISGISFLSVNLQADDQDPGVTVKVYILDRV